ncbi:family 78 glycoside hydrolase catalytic domain [Paenibacillus sp. NPDC056579]|uniref:alpha-L-rhamnosidase n=1 Tax=Paenibacillus sp. NPDC056579 TaxID=3345871 RepID=UPI003684B8F1
MNTDFKMVHLRCEYQDNPIGLGTERPRFSWKLQSDRPHVLQTAYHIQLADSPDTLSNGPWLWDTGQTQSSQSILVEYDGAQLQSDRHYYYRVRAWDNYGRLTDWSDIAHFQTGLLNITDWEAEWITPNGVSIRSDAEEIFLLRKEFQVEAAIKQATIYATSLGLYELELNGKRVGDMVYTPGWTSYKYRLQVQSYDITEELTVGGVNVLGASLANGWYMGYLAWENKHHHYGNRRALICQIHIVYENGTKALIVTDSSWRASTGPVLMSEIYHGERYDARLEKLGWSCSDYAAEDWSTVEVLPFSKSGLIMQENEPVRIIQKLEPSSVIATPDGDKVIDMGQNMVGRVQLNLDLPRGTSLKLEHAEVLDAKGNFYIGNLRNAKQTVEYVCRGGGEIWEPSFTFQGFRYVRVTGWPETVPFTLDSFTGHVIHSDMLPSGEFECSHPLVNQLQSNIVWGQRGNFLDVPTDCPQRDERLGWTGDAHVFIRTAAFNYDVALFFRKWLHDLKVDQREDGAVPFVVPNVLNDESFASAAWGDAAVICPWVIYMVYADKRVLEEQYESMRSWVDYIRRQGLDEHLWNTGFHFGDWLGLDAKEGSYFGATPNDLIATCFYAYSTKLFVKTAEILGRTEDVVSYGNLYEQIVSAFSREFITPRGRLAAHTQTGHVLPLIFNLVDGSVRERLARTLAEYVVEEGNHLTTGFVGTPYLCQVLTETGYHDLAVKLLQQEEYPSWLYSVRQGATTIWEHWDGIKPDGSFWNDDMNSYNHYAYGAVGDWLYRTVAGLDQDFSEPGYKRILFHPRPDSNMNYARATYESVYGTIRSEWHKEENGTVTYLFQVPVNTTAKAILRGANLETTVLNGKQVVNGELGILAVTEIDGALLLEIGSGFYTFLVTGVT